MTTATQTLRQQFARTMLRIGEMDPRLVVLVCDISHGALQPFAKACPGRFFNLGILESTAMNLASGLSKTGLYPVLHTISPFLIERAFEQIKLGFGYQGLGGNIVTIGSAFDFSVSGCTHHCYGDFAMIKTIPGAEMIFAASAREFDELFEQSYANDKLTVFRLATHSHGVDLNGQVIHIGRGMRVAEGATLTLVATGPQLRTALDAKTILDQQGWDTEIIYIHTIRPLDAEILIESARKTGHVVVLEEHSPYGGLSDDVLRAVHGVDGLRFKSISLPEAFVTEYGTYDELCESLGFTPDAVCRQINSEFHHSPN